MASRNFFRFTILAVGIVVLLPVFCTFLVDILIQGASYTGSESQTDIDTKLHYLQIARSMPVPSGSPVFETEGDLCLRHATLVAQDAAQFQQQAIQAYRKSIKAEPVRALLWAKFAMAKAVTGELDTEFYTAFDQAIRYGGAELDTNRIIVWIGLTRLQSLHT